MDANLYFSSQAWHSHSCSPSTFSLFCLLSHTICVFHTETLPSPLCSSDWAPLDCTLAWASFGTSVPSLTLPHFLGPNFQVCPVQHVLTEGPLGGLPHVADFPLHQSQIVYFSILPRDEQGAPSPQRRDCHHLTLSNIWATQRTFRTNSKALQLIAFWLPTIGYFLSFLCQWNVLIAYKNLWVFNYHTLTDFYWMCVKRNFLTVQFWRIFIE